MCIRDSTNTAQLKLLNDVKLCQMSFLEIRSQKATSISSLLQKQLRDAYENCLLVCIQKATSMNPNTNINDDDDDDDDDDPKADESKNSAACGDNELRMQDLLELFTDLMTVKHMFMFSLEALLM